MIMLPISANNAIAMKNIHGVEEVIPEDFTDASRWRRRGIVSGALSAVTSTTFSISDMTSQGAVMEIYDTDPPDLIRLKLKVTGLDDIRFSIDAYKQGVGADPILPPSPDGVYEISYHKDLGRYFSFRFNRLFSGRNIVIEQLPVVGLESIEKLYGVEEVYVQDFTAVWGYRPSETTIVASLTKFRIDIDRQLTTAYLAGIRTNDFNYDKPFAIDVNLNITGGSLYFVYFGADTNISIALTQGENVIPPRPDLSDIPVYIRASGLELTGYVEIEQLPVATPVPVFNKRFNPANVLGYWRFDLKNNEHPTRNVVDDLSGNGNHLQVYGSDFNETDSGYRGGKLYLDGIKDYLRTINNLPAFKSNAYTIIFDWELLDKTRIAPQWLLHKYATYMYHSHNVTSQITWYNLNANVNKHGLPSGLIAISNNLAYTADGRAFENAHPTNVDVAAALFIGNRSTLPADGFAKLAIGFICVVSGNNLPYEAVAAIRDKMRDNTLLS